MSIHTTAFTLLIGSLFAAGGCSEPPTPEKKSAPQHETKPSDPGPTDAAAQADPVPAQEEGGVSEPVNEDPPDSRRKHPSWYSPDVIAHRKVIQDGRSEAQEDGTFSSALVLELEPGMKPEECLQTLVAKAEADGLAFGNADKGADGRLTVRTENERMRVTFVCGEAKGMPTAFVGYEWKPGA